MITLAARSCAMRITASSTSSCTRICFSSSCSAFGLRRCLVRAKAIPLFSLRSSGGAMRAAEVQMRGAANAAGWEKKVPENDEERELLNAGALKSDGFGGGNQGDGGNAGGGGGGGEGQGDAHGGEDRPLHPVLAWYMKLLEERPVLTKAVTAAILTFIGDLFTQLVIEKSGSVDVKRIAVITSLGFMLVGPTLHFWYLALSKVVKFGGMKGAGVRLLLDQLVFSPVFIAVFFVSLLVMEGRPSDIGPKLSQDWASAVVTNWKIWVPFQFVNFLFVPQQLQVAFANVISLAWNAYLSFATHTEVDEEKH